MSQTETFKRSITVIDTETTNLLPELCEIVEVAGATWNGNAWEASSMLLGAYDGIPPEASAKNNISSRMISGLPKFDRCVDQIKDVLGWDRSAYLIAHNAEYDRAALKTAFEKMHAGADVKRCLDQSRWICTWRLSKQVLIHDFNDAQYGLSYLRYRLDLPIPDSVGVHRADADTLVCAALLDRLIDVALENGQLDPDGDIGRQLNQLCWDHINIKTWPFGKHRGVPLVDIDNDYYTWALKTLPQLKEGDASFDADLSESVRRVLEQRLNSF